MPPYGGDGHGNVAVVEWTSVPTAEQLWAVVYPQVSEYHRKLYGDDHYACSTGYEPRLPPVTVVRTPVMGHSKGWWGPMRCPSTVGSLALIILQKNRRDRETQRRKDRQRRSQPDICKQRHERKVRDAIDRGTQMFSEEELVALAREGAMKKKASSEHVESYILFSLPQRGVIYCPVSKEQKISSAVAVRRDLVEVPWEGMDIPGPACICSREFTKLAAGARSSSNSPQTTGDSDDVAADSAESS